MASKIYSKMLMDNGDLSALFTFSRKFAKFNFFFTQM